MKYWEKWTGWENLVPTVRCLFYELYSYHCHIVMREQSIFQQLSLIWMLWQHVRMGEELECKKSRLHAIDKLGQHLLFSEHFEPYRLELFRGLTLKEKIQSKWCVLIGMPKKEMTRLYFLVPTWLCIKQMGNRKGGLYKVNFTVICVIYLSVYFLSRDGVVGKGQTSGISKFTTTCVCRRDQIWYDDEE